MSAINHVDPPDLSLPKQPWKKGGGWSRSRSLRCCRGIRWDSPILGDLSNKYGDIIGVIIGVIGNVPCITKKIFKKYVENGFSPETHWTIRHETRPKSIGKASCLLWNWEKWQFWELCIVFRYTLNRKIGDVTRNYGDIWSRNGKIGLLRIGKSDWEWRCSSKEMEIWPRNFGRLNPQTLTGDWLDKGRSGKVGKRLTIWCEPPGWPDQSDVWPSVQAVRQVDCRIGISWNSRYGNQTWKI